MKSAGIENIYIILCRSYVASLAVSFLHRFSFVSFRRDSFAHHWPMSWSDGILRQRFSLESFPCVGVPFIRGVALFNRRARLSVGCPGYPRV